MLASPRGGPAPLDPSSIDEAKSANDAVSTAFLAQHRPLWESTAPLSSFQGSVDDFAAVFFPGGHGPMWDLAGDAASQALMREFVRRGKVVAAVCHGPAALVGVKAPATTTTTTDELWLKGKRVTGFSNAEEKAVGLDGAMPFLLEDRLAEAVGGEGKYEKAAEMWAEKVVVDGQLITGQNPASAKGVAEAIARAVKGG